MATEWYYAINRKTAGPITVESLRQLATSGKLKRDDLVWKDGLPRWIRAEEFAGLFVDDPLSSTVRTQPHESEIQPQDRPDVPKITVSRPLDSSDSVKGRRIRLIAGIALATATLIVGGAAWLSAMPRGIARNEPRMPPAKQIAVNNFPAPLEIVAPDGNQDREQQPADQNDGLPNVANVEEQVRNDTDARPDAVEVTWQRFKHPNGVAEIEMPSKPVFNPDNGVVPPQPGVRQFSVRPAAEMNLDHPTTYTASIGDFSCSLQVSKLAPFLVKQIAANPAEFVKSVKLFGDIERDSLKDESDIHFVSDKPLRLGNARGREFQIESPKNIVVSRWYMTQTHQCRASMVLPKDRDTTDERERFFNSLALNGSSTPQDPQNATASGPRKVVPVPKDNEADRKSNWKLFHSTDVKPSRETSSSRFIGSEEFGTTATLTTDGRDILAIPHNGKWSAVAFDVSSQSKLPSLYCALNGIGLNFGDSIHPGKWTPVVVVYSQSRKTLTCLVNGKVVSTASATSNKMSDQLLLKIASKTPLNRTLEFRKFRVWTDATPPAEIIELAGLNAIQAPADPPVSEKPAEPPVAVAQLPAGGGQKVEAVEPLPVAFRDYFERADKEKSDLIKGAENKIALEEIALRGASPKSKAFRTRLLSDMKDSLLRLKKTKPIGYMPTNMEVNSVGVLRSCEVLAVIDERTIVANCQGVERAFTAVLKLDSTKGIQAGSKLTPLDAWTVVDFDGLEDKSVALFLSRRGSPVFGRSGPEKAGIAVLEIIKKSELEKYRAAYEAVK